MIYDFHMERVVLRLIRTFPQGILQLTKESRAHETFPIRTTHNAKRTPPYHREIPEVCSIAPGFASPATNSKAHVIVRVNRWVTLSLDRRLNTPLVMRKCRLRIGYLRMLLCASCLFPVSA